MLTAILAVRNLMGESHNLWDVNTERSYYKEFSRRGSAPLPPEVGGRRTHLLIVLRPRGRGAELRTREGKGVYVSKPTPSS